MIYAKRKIIAPLAVGLVLVFLYYSSWFGDRRPPSELPRPDAIELGPTNFLWRTLPTHYPVQSMLPLPTGRPLKLPQVQHSFSQGETEDAKATRLQRQAAVKQSFRRCWDGYRAHAWLQDELAPLSGSFRNPFGGWAATLVDSLDTLWMMGLRDEFDDAVAATANISFETSSLSEVNAFETTIRYLGGFLAAYDLSGDQRLLHRARDVGDMLYVAFDTPNRMPITRWDFAKAARGERQEAHQWALVAEIGSLCMEFTRLSLLTGDPKWFDATERITQVFVTQQNMTKLPGMWPISINPRDLKFYEDNTFGLGAMADSVYEYLPKMYGLVGGLLPEYGDMYRYAIDTSKKYNMYHPMTPDEADILIAANVHAVQDERGRDRLVSDDQGQHLVCFAGGMLAIGAKLLDRPDDLATARKLTQGCVWAYAAMPHGLMPEVFALAACAPPDAPCAWNETAWKAAVLARAGPDPASVGQGELDAAADRVVADRRLPRGFTEIADARYILRPEAIESVFVLYRVTGEAAWAESAWAMFQAVEKATRTELANAALADVSVAAGTRPPQTDSMESFWMGETLKYFYLIFSEPGLVSLDEYMFNTEAHPLKRLVR
ncbi:family 47 glycoside hydrolase [Xylariomycetidae sp. FL0641]|nr:family 47 glycoside hydrolase [Xylariomycetidae sp. FL0641]